VHQVSGIGFGAGHIANVLKGSLTEQMETWGHQGLSTFGLMAKESIPFIRYLIEQLIGQGYLRREASFPLSPLRIPPGKSCGRRDAHPDQTAGGGQEEGDYPKDPDQREKEWAGVDEELFQLLRQKRAELARQQGVPAFIIFGDKSLKDMATIKPTTRDAFATVYGVGITNWAHMRKPFWIRSKISLGRRRVNGIFYADSLFQNT